MPATEIVVTSIGKAGGKEILQPTGAKGNVFPAVQDWLVGKKKAGISVRDVSTTVLVKGVGQWAVYEEPIGPNTIQTVFEIT